MRGYHPAVTPPVTADDVRAAWARIHRFVLRTPLTLSPGLSERAGVEIALKQENRQHTGSFKPRGALNKILTIERNQWASKGFSAASAGNHALGVAFAAEALGNPRAHLFVQGNASPAKLAKLRRFKTSELHLVGETFEEAQQAALAHAKKFGATFISAYDDPAVVAGQGTVGLEIVDEAGRIDTVVVPTGGGALLGGIALAVKDVSPRTRVVGVNPEASPSAKRSLEEGRALDPFAHGPTLAHGLAGGFGRTGFEIAKAFVDEVVLVSEKEMADATAALVDTDQLVVEPSGIAGLAAVLAGKVKPAGRTVVVLSGGNVDSSTLATLLTRAAAA